MTNRERYRKTFDVLHASPETLEVFRMKQHRRRFHMTKLVVIAACLVALLATSAFAANVISGGNLGFTVLSIFNGETREVELTDLGDGCYTFENGGMTGTITAGEHSAAVSVEGGQGENQTIEVILPDA